MSKIRKYTGYIIIMVILMVITTILMLYSSPRRYAGGYIQDNSYIDKRYGITFEFPKGWHPNINSNTKESNILVVVHKDKWNDRNPAKNKDGSQPYPYMLLTGYDVGRYFFKSLSEISEAILEQEFKTPGISNHNIISRRILKRKSRDIYEVMIDMQYLRGGQIRTSGIFLKNGRYLFFLSFNDKMESFEKNIHFFNDIKDKLKVGI